jgi:hypothetical protein
LTIRGADSLPVRVPNMVADKSGTANHALEEIYAFAARSGHFQSVHKRGTNGEVGRPSCAGGVPVAVTQGATSAENTRRWWRSGGADATPAIGSTAIARRAPLPTRPLGTHPARAAGPQIPRWLRSSSVAPEQTIRANSVPCAERSGGGASPLRNAVGDLRFPAEGRHYAAKRLGSILATRRTCSIGGTNRAHLSLPQGGRRVPHQGGTERFATDSSVNFKFFLQ